MRVCVVSFAASVVSFIVSIVSFSASVESLFADITQICINVSYTNRYFEAYNHVRIYSDSLQAVGDSLFYSGEDSVFRLFKEPIVWSRDSQITGDTIYLYTQNKKPKRMYV